MKSRDLKKKQIEFARMLPRLLDKAFELGFEITLGDAYRGPTCSHGHPQSFHKLRLAIDINLFRNDVFLTSTEDHRPLGEFWESIGGTWGGHFNDGNHYSFGERR